MLRDDCRGELAEIIDALRGEKVIVVDDALYDLLHKEAAFASSDEGNLRVTSLAQFLGATQQKAPPDHVVYLTRPQFAAVKAVAVHIKQCVEVAGWKSQHHVYFCPTRTVACDQILEDEGALPHAVLGEYRLGFVPLDGDVLALGTTGSLYRDVAVNGDASGLHAVSSALHRLQLLHGAVPNIRCKGALARKIVLQLSNLRSSRAHEPLFQLGGKFGTAAYRPGDNNDDEDEEGEDCDDEDEYEHGEAAAPGAVEEPGFDLPPVVAEKNVTQRRPVRIDDLFIVDRDLDLVSPLVTPLTYEGLLTELITAEYGSVMDGDTCITLDDENDPIYAEIRHLNIEHIGPCLQAKAIDVKKRYADFRGNKDASIAEIHDFVKQARDAPHPARPLTLTQPSLLPWRCQSRCRS